MFSPDDTIAAIATPPGRGGLGVVRISGPEAVRIAGALLDRGGRLRVRRATLARIRGSDQVVATYFQAPHSYTGQDVVELSAHGSPTVLQQIVQRALAAGARLARPGEFTLRAFLNGKLDLVQAEAVADLVNSATPLQATVAFDQLEGTLTEWIAAIDRELFDMIAALEASLDFPDEGYHFISPETIAARIDAVVERIDRLLEGARRGRMIREGASVVIAGRPNVGKSSLFNALAGSDRAIVTDVPGTTRDLVSERVDIEGILVTLVDTAGARDAVEIVEREGVSRATRARSVADLVLVVLDRAAPFEADDRSLLEQTANARRIVVANKSDLASERAGADDIRSASIEVVNVSAKTGDGVPGLRRRIARALAGEASAREPAAISNIRHVSLTEQAREHLLRARAGAAKGDVPEEFLLTDLHEARARFDEVVGRRTTDDLLRSIFERFCIGK
jgi:tRNA modification GTPase